jgi:site-specific DNA-methyltransferase (adenine-specific)
MSEVKTRSIHLVITSPPYWQLKDYGSPGQIGYHDSYENYINHLNLVWHEVYRILYPGCRLCINIGDQFARASYYGRYRILPIRTEIIRFCQAVGLDYMGAIIWQKQTTTNTSGGGSVMGSYPYPRNGIIKLDYEFILIFKKPGVAPPVTTEVKEKSKLSKEEWKTYFSGHWQIPGEKQKGHLAVFPLEIPFRLIRMFSFVGDSILDPFAGSGTTSEAAAALERNSCAYEIDESNLSLVKDRLRQAKIKVLVNNNPIPFDFAGRIKELPHRFTDPAGLDKLKDPKQDNFGSRIDKKSKPRETYYRVKKIVSPTKIILNNGKELTLLGLVPRAGKTKQAIDFLRDITRGTRIFLRFENDSNQTEVYVYLENNTFVNAHLLKQNLASVNTKINFKHKKRFLTYQRNAK